MKNLLYLLVSLSIPIVFIYPQGLLYGTYLNYAFAVLCAILLFLLPHNKNVGISLRFYLNILMLNFFANLVSCIIGSVTPIQFLSGNAITICAFCLSFIVSSFPSDKMHILKGVMFLTTLLVVALIFLDGVSRPFWLYELFFLKNSVDYENVGTIFQRAMGSLLSPVMAGFFCVCVATYYFVQSVYVKVSAVSLFFIAFSILGLFLTGSRTAMLALLCMFLYFMCFYKFRNKHSILFFLLAGIFVFNFFDLSFLDDIIENLLFRNEQLSSGAFEGTGRTATFMAAIENKFDIRCLFWGIGISEYSLVENQEFSLAHNGFLSILIPYGLVGLHLHYRLYKHYLIFNDSFYLDKLYLIFTSLWVIILLGTFFTADLPVNHFSLCIQAIVLALADRQKKIYR